MFLSCVSVCAGVRHAPAFPWFAFVNLDGSQNPMVSHLGVSYF